MNRFFRRLAITPITLLLFILLTSCSNNDPIKLGFVGSLSGAVSDLGTPSRNGMLLAIEHINRNGGIDGRHVDVIIRDDKHDPQEAEKIIEEFVNSGVAAIIGPVTSTMAAQVVEQANNAKTLMMGLTVTTDELSGKDDYFLRCLASTKSYTASIANYLTQELGLRSYTAILDLENGNFSHNWHNHFREHFVAMGGSETAVYEFNSGDRPKMLEIAESIANNNSEITILVTTALDGAIFSKLLREQQPDIRLATTEWASTKRLLELGGRNVEGVIVPQFVNLNNAKPAYVDFRDRYLERFAIPPGFPSIVAYDATNVILKALSIDDNPKALKDTILNAKTFDGLQGPISFDKYGDGSMGTLISEVQGGQFQFKAEK